MIFIRSSIIISLIIINIGYISSSEATKLSFSDVLDKANQTKLSEKRYWHLLMHYKSKKIGRGFVSAVDDEKFFLSVDGKINPKSELEQTIKHLFYDELLDQFSTVDKCSFIARYDWIVEQLGFDDLEILSCSDYENFLSKINPDSVSFIFSSAYMNNPASMFGHTFLRINKKGKEAYPLLAATTIDYVANIAGSGSIGVVALGSVGGFKGKFTILPYHVKVRTYTDIDNRDIWEYRLNLTEIQISKMMKHIWELQEIYFDYFYFTENCSYNILTLLEIADPEMYLTDQYRPWVIPLDTVHLLMKQDGLVASVKNRPSSYTKIRRKRERLTRSENKLFNKIVHDLDVVNSENFMNLSKKTQALMMDIGSDYLKYKRMSSWTKETQNMAGWYEFMDKKRKLNEKINQIKITPYIEKPDKGHKTLRVSIGFGLRDGDFFEELTMRGAYHDLLDPSEGYPFDSQIELMKINVRHYKKNDDVRLEKLTLADVKAIIPYDSLFVRPSWKVKAEMETLEFDDCRYCYNFVVNVGIGSAIESHIYNREVYFLFSELDMNYAKQFDDNHRIGGGVTLGTIVDVNSRWKILVSGTYLTYPFGDDSENIRMSVHQRMTLNKNSAFKMDFNYRKNDSEIVTSVNMYF